jgi:hypothetical protein
VHRRGVLHPGSRGQRRGARRLRLVRLRIVGMWEGAVMRAALALLAALMGCSSAAPGDCGSCPKADIEALLSGTLCEPSCYDVEGSPRALGQAVGVPGTCTVADGEGSCTQCSETACCASHLASLAALTVTPVERTCLEQHCAQQCRGLL